MIEADIVRRYLDYNPNTGIFTWKLDRSNAKKGDVAGTMSTSGYWQICLFGTIYPAHRVAWTHYYGKPPRFTVDHKDHNKLNNMIDNLRDVSNAENNKNQPMSRLNKSGVNGVHYCNQRKRWCAKIRVNYKYINLGRYKDKFEAICARKSADKKYGFHENHGRSV